MKKIILALCIALGLSAQSADTLTGTEAYNFFLKQKNSSDKAVFKMAAEADSGRAVVLAFFSEECLPCRKELPLLDSLGAALDDVRTVAVSVDRTYPAALVTTLGLQMPVLHDSFKIVAKKYGYVGQLPYTVYIDKEGHIVETSNTYSDAKRDTLIRMVENLR